MRIAHISDFHYTHPTWNPFRLLSKRFLGRLNWALNRKGEFAAELLDPLPQLFEDLKVDWVLLGGDFTTTSMPEEYALAQKFVEKLRQNWIAIPGNHDHYTYWSYKTKRFYNYFPNSLGLFGYTLKDHGIEAHQISPIPLVTQNLACGLRESALNWIIALDTTRATHLCSSKGLFSKELERSMEEVLQLIPHNHSILVFNHYPFFQNDKPKRNLTRGDALMALLKREKRILLYLHGHTHRHIIANLQPNGLPALLDSGSCTQVKMATWNLIDVEPSGCTIFPYRWNGRWENHQKESLVWMRS